ncbi:dynein axonemal heavy chain 9-like [Calonectris borealis]|uniref:dynein axonemal heavy chain 9-like n=1 Tax=Calonectris borealis TaxID=1323832 RepID=UPI003F4BF590
MRHVHSLKSTVFMVVGQVKGKTLLPLPAGSEGIEDVDLENEKSLELIDKSLVHATESAIIDWSYQIQGALKKESSEPLLQGSNPNPKVELEFWKNRCDDLECIYNQLRTRKVRNMMEVLERVESSYVPAFKSMLMDVEAALTEAQDIYLHLTPLKRHLEDIEKVEFSAVKPFLVPLLHVVCLIWVTSKHYNVPGRIVVLLQEICNLLIQQALVYLSPEDLLKGEMEESLGKVQMVLGILNAFKGAFEERREKLHTYYEPGQEVREWDFHATMVFARLDSFLKRLEMVEDLLATALDLMKLEKIEFSGIKGKALGQQVLDMYEEFQEAYKVFAERTYDCLELTNMEFEQDAFGFQQKVEDIDRRLGTVFILAFDDASDLEHAFKLLDMFGSLLERPIIAAGAADKYSVLISMFNSALDHARLIYSRHIQAELELGSPTVHKNMPPVAGALGWARELRARIQVPFGHFRHITHLCLDSAEGRRVIEKYEDMIHLLDRYQEKLYVDWSQTVSEKSQYNLTQPLIRQDPETKLITVNFDPQVKTAAS